jgi:Na+/H+-dicarboxylate symporter
MDESRPKAAVFRTSPTTRILLAMMLGGLAGTALGPQIHGIGQVGNVVIGLIKMLAAPLILFAVLDAFLRSAVRARSGLFMVGIATVNAAFALTIAMTLANSLLPGRFLAVPGGTPSAPGFLPGVRPVRFLDDLLALLPTNLVDPFRTNAIVPVVVLAVLAGAALRRYKDEQVTAGGRDYLVIEQLVKGVLVILERMLGWVVALLPLAVFAVMAQTVGTQGLAALRGLGVYLGVVILGLALHVGLVYHVWILFVARVPLRAFWKALRAPLACAAGSSSSLATLPVTLRSLRTMGVSDGSARMSVCVAANLNHDGILLYELMAALIVAQAFGVPLTFGQQLTVAGVCVLAGVGIAGVPEAGLISLAIVLTSARLPLDLLPLLLSVDWLLGRCRAMTNVMGSMVGAVVLDRLDAPRNSEVGEPAREIDGYPIETHSSVTALA